MESAARIEMFMAVVKHGGFAPAARALGVTGPALSKQVQALEEELGVQLLRRTTRQVHLTEQGEIYTRHAQAALEELYAAQRELHELSHTLKGTLRLAASMSFGVQYLAKPLADFAALHPELHLHIDFDDRHVDILEERYDMVVRIGTLEDSSLMRHKLAECPLMLCASPAWLASQPHLTHPAQLCKLPYIAYGRHNLQREWHYTHHSGSEGRVQLTPSMQANNAEMMVEACKAGVGLAVLPIFSVADALHAGELSQVLPEYATHPMREIVVLTPPTPYVPQKVKACITALKQACKQLPW